MTVPPSCPSCNTPLGLFTPREAESHVNACLDAQEVPSDGGEKPSCAVCGRDLGPLTAAARIEHANRCADTLLPLPPTDRPPSRRRRRAAGGNSNSGIRSGGNGSGGGGNGQQQALRPVQNEGEETTGEQTEQKCDPRVEHLLKMLGLERYAPRFAREEIDLVALRLLTDDDLAALSIPDAARRRIADAMHSVPILAQLQRVKRHMRDIQASQRIDKNKLQPLQERRRRSSLGKNRTALDDGTAFGGAETRREGGDKEAEGEGGNSLEEEGGPVATQKFAESRIGVHVLRAGNGVMGDATDEEEEYVPSQRAPPLRPRSPSAVSPAGASAALPVHVSVGPRADLASLEHPSAPCDAGDERAVGNGKNGNLLEMSPSARGTCNGRGQNELFPSLSRGDDFHESGRRDDPSDASEASSSLASDLADLSRVVNSSSQISVDVLLQKWKRRQIDREHLRHKREIARIENRYAYAVRQAFNLTQGTSKPGENIENNNNESSSNTGEEWITQARQAEDMNDVHGDDDVIDDEVIDLTQDFGAVYSPIKGGGADNASGGGIEIRNAKFREQNEQEEQQNVFVVSSGSLPQDNYPKSSAAEKANEKNKEEVDDCQFSSPPSPPSTTRHGQELPSGTAEDCENSDDDFENMLLHLGTANPAKNNAYVNAAISRARHNDKERDEQYDESDDEILDLIGDEYGNEFGCTMEDDAGETRNKSRLKKKRRPGKAKDEDIIQAIHAEDGVHQDILMMKCIPFNRILQSVRNHNVNVSKKSLHDFLVRQGVTFKGDTPSGPQSQQYMNSLNTDARNQSD